MPKWWNFTKSGHTVRWRTSLAYLARYVKVVRYQFSEAFWLFWSIRFQTSIMWMSKMTFSWHKKNIIFRNKLIVEYIIMIMIIARWEPNIIIRPAPNEHNDNFGHLSIILLPSRPTKYHYRQLQEPFGLTIDITTVVGHLILGSCYLARRHYHPIHKWVTVVD